MLKKLYGIVFSVFFLLSAVQAADQASGIVARVNGAEITVKELENSIDEALPKMSYHGGVSVGVRDEIREKVLQKLIDIELAYQDALAKGMKPDNKEVRVQLDRAEKQFRSKKEYRQALEAQGLSEEKLRAWFEKSQVVDQIVQKTVQEPARMTDDALKQYYENNISKFKQPESYRLWELSAKEEKKMQEAMDKLKAGQDFGQIAWQMSEDSYRVKDGDRGYVHKGTITSDLEDILAVMKIGELKGPVKLADTWYVLKLVDKKPEKQVPYQEAKEKLKKELEAKRSQELMSSWMKELHAKAKIEIIMKKQPDENSGVMK